MTRGALDADGQALVGEEHQAPAAEAAEEGEAEDQQVSMNEERSRIPDGCRCPECVQSLPDPRFYMVAARKVVTVTRPRRAGKTTPTVRDALSELMYMSKAEAEALDAGRHPRVEFVRDGELTRIRYVPDYRTCAAAAVERARLELRTDEPACMSDRVARWLAEEGIAPVSLDAVSELMRSAEEVRARLEAGTHGMGPELLDALAMWGRMIRTVQDAAEWHWRRLGLAP